MSWTTGFHRILESRKPLGDSKQFVKHFDDGEQAHAQPEAERAAHVAHEAGHVVVLRLLDLRVLDVFVVDVDER